MKGRGRWETSSLASASQAPTSPCQALPAAIDHPSPSPRTAMPSESVSHLARMSAGSCASVRPRADRASRLPSSTSLAFWIVSSPLIDNDPSRTLQDVKPVVSGLVGDRAVAPFLIPALTVRPPSCRLIACTRPEPPRRHLRVRSSPALSRTFSPCRTPSRSRTPSSPRPSPNSWTRSGASSTTTPPSSSSTLE